MRHLVALIALATVLISTPAFPTWKTSYHTDNLTGLKYPEDIVVQGRLTHDGSPAENRLNFGSIHYDCEDQIFRIILITPHRSIPSSFDVSKKSKPLVAVSGPPQSPYAGYSTGRTALSTKWNNSNHQV